MPDKDGILTVVEKQVIAAWLSEKSRSNSCPVCLASSWSVGGHLLSGKIYRGGNLAFGGPTYPMAFVVCTNCAYVREFMAVQIGLLEAPGSESETDSVTDAETAR